MVRVAAMAAAEAVGVVVTVVEVAVEASARMAIQKYRMMTS
jgi:hypothetical protein